MNYYLKYIFSVVTAMSLAHSAYHYHSQFAGYINTIKGGDDGSPVLGSSIDALLGYFGENNSTSTFSTDTAADTARDLEEPEKEPENSPPVEVTEPTKTAKKPPQKTGKKNTKNKKNPATNLPPKNSTSAPSESEEQADAGAEAEADDNPPQATSTEDSSPSPNPKGNLPSQKTAGSPASKTKVAFKDLTRKEQLQIVREKEAAKKFYSHHQQQMKLLVNTSTLMDWNRHRRKRGKYSQFLDNFAYYHIGSGKDQLQKVPNITNYDFYYHGGGLCNIAKVFANYRKGNHGAPVQPLPHVMIARMNQDFGALSSNIDGKTAKLWDLKKQWAKEKCTVEFIFDYINHPDTLAVFTNQFQIFDHPKVISIPVGLGPGNHNQLIQEATTLQQLLPQDEQQPPRPQLLMINAMERGMRKKAIQAVLKNFQTSGYTARNTYKAYTPDICNATNAKTCYLREMQRAKFIMSPAGLGLDCYRHWEAMYLGCIPVLERNYRTKDGWFNRTLAELPVAWIDSFNDLTPEYLEQEYQRIVVQKDPSQYNFEKLTRQYWIRLAYSIVEEHKKTTKTQQQQ